MSVENEYDRFFGYGHWEKDYKPHIVAFAKKCIERALLEVESAKTDTQQTKVPISDLADEFIDNTDLSSIEESGVNQFVTWIGQKQ